VDLFSEFMFCSSGFGWACFRFLSGLIICVLSFEDRVSMLGALTSRIGEIDGGVVRVTSTWVYRVVLMEAGNLLLNESFTRIWDWRGQGCFLFLLCVLGRRFGWEQAGQGLGGGGLKVAGVLGV